MCNQLDKFVTTYDNPAVDYSALVQPENPLPDPPVSPEASPLIHDGALYRSKGNVLPGWHVRLQLSQQLPVLPDAYVCRIRKGFVNRLSAAKEAQFPLNTKCCHAVKRMQGLQHPGKPPARLLRQPGHQRSALRPARRPQHSLLPRRQRVRRHLPRRMRRLPVRLCVNALARRLLAASPQVRNPEDAPV